MALSYISVDTSILFISHLIDTQRRKPYVHNNYSADANSVGYEKNTDGCVYYSLCVAPF